MMVYSDAQVHPTVKNCNVKILRVDRAARHKDQAVRQDFVEDLTTFLLSVRS